MEGLYVKGFPRDQLLPRDLITSIGEAYNVAIIEALYQIEATPIREILELYIVRFAVR